MTSSTAGSPLAPVELAYGHWPSPLDAATLFAGTEHISWARPAEQGVFFLLSLPQEGNAQALMHLSATGTLQRVTPAGMNLRSQVHEYGGLPYASDATQVYYSNLSDQRVYRQPFDQHNQRSGEPVALTPQPTTARALRYADFLMDPDRKRLLCVREDHRNANTAPRNALVALPIDSESAGELLFDNSDFVASPRLSPDGQRLVFQTWVHPDMPWDHTQLWLAQLDRNGHIQASRQLCADRPGSLLQPAFAPDGAVYFLADWSDWWNLYRIDAEALLQPGADNAHCMLATKAECCTPPWQLGQRHYDFIDANSVVLGLQHDGSWDLISLQATTGEQRFLARGLATLDDLHCGAGQVLFLAATTTSSAALYRLSPGAVPAPPTDAPLPDAAPTTGAGNTALIHPLWQTRGIVTLTRRACSRPRHFSFTTAAGTQAHGLYYPPCNARYQAPAGALPPLLVNVHGGPTSSARSAWNPAVQFWTTRGFAWLDVNHRGSTGYGRHFRHSLYGQWGVVDIEDVIHAVQHLLDAGLANPQRIAIRGGSAGGFTVLAALASSTLFRAGVSYYGVADLERLARDTHKFESRYLDQLIGPYPEQAALYRQRSPLHRIAQISAPVLLLQGRQDKVVPPNQAEALFRQLQEQHPASACLYFDDEGHGFRKPHNQTVALEAELDFYRQQLL